jgi:hypothetical protein
MRKVDRPGSGRRDTGGEEGRTTGDDGSGDD